MPQSESQTLKQLARQVFEDVQNQQNYDLIPALVREDYVGHTPHSLADINGHDGAKRYDMMLHDAFPDLKLSIEQQIAEGDSVATRWTCRGTHLGSFQGLPATGQSIEVQGITIFRIEDGMIAEGWSNPDLLGIVDQIRRALPPR